MAANSASMQKTKTPATASPQRKVTLRVKSGRRTEDESDAAHVVDHRRLLRLIDLSPQSTHVHVDQVRLRHEFVLPHLLEQHGACKNLVLALHHVFEQAEF